MFGYHFLKSGVYALTVIFLLQACSSSVQSSANFSTTALVTTPSTNLPSTPALALISTNSAYYTCAANGTTGTFSSCATPIPTTTLSALSTTLQSFNGTTYAYLADGSANIYQCPYNADGSLGTCAITNGGAVGWAPQNISFLNVSGTQYAFVYDGNGNLYQCSVTVNTGAISGCAINNGGVSAWYPTGMTTITITGTLYALVTDQNSSYGNTVNFYICPVTAGSGIGTCVEANFTSITGWDTGTQISSGLVYATVNGTTYAYVGSYEPSGWIAFQRTYQCTLDPTTGTFSNCNASGPGQGVLAPYNLNFVTVGGNPYLYYADAAEYTVGYCTIDPTSGALLSCGSIGPNPVVSGNAGYPTGLSFVTTNGNTYLEIANTSGTPNVCLINPADGTLSCNSANSGLNAYHISQFSIAGSSVLAISNHGLIQCSLDPAAAGFLACQISGLSALPYTQYQKIGANPYLYAVDQGGTILKCPVNKTTGAYTTCDVEDTGISVSWSPQNIAFHTATTSGTLYAYIPDVIGNLYQCSVDSTTGSLSACAANNDGMTWAPNSISFATIGSTDYAYLSDDSYDNAYQCGVDATNGQLINCAVSNGGNTTWYPSGLQMVSVSGVNFAYAYQNTEIFVCSVDPATGNLLNCNPTDTGANGLNYTGIALGNFGGSTYAYITLNNGNILKCSTDKTTGALADCDFNNGDQTWNSLISVAFISQ